MTDEKEQVWRDALEKVAYPMKRGDWKTTGLTFEQWASSVAANALSYGHRSYVPPKGAA